MLKLYPSSRGNVAWALLPERGKRQDRRSGKSAQPTVGSADHDKVSSIGLELTTGTSTHMQLRFLALVNLAPRVRNCQRVSLCVRRCILVLNPCLQVHIAFVVS